MDRSTFFDRVRASVFGGALSQPQVDGMIVILDAWKASRLTDPRWVAYMLATVFHETARTMQPIVERGSRSYFDKYDGRKALGNTQPGDGYRFRGRGFVQITGRRNYTAMSKVVGVDLVKDPDAALRPDIASRIMFHGMTNGSFTGKKLADYIGPSGCDYQGARRIINGSDKAALIAGYAAAFERALTAARAPAPARVPIAPPLPPAKPLSAAEASGVAALVLGFGTAAAYWWQEATAFLSSIFGG